MDTNTLKICFLGILLAVFAGGAQAAITSETRPISHDMNALFLWAVDPSDMTFDRGTSNFSSLTGWVLDTNPYGAPVPDNSAWVIAAPDIAIGGGVVAAGSGTVEIGFDYVVGGGPFGASVFRYQYALVLYNGLSATVQTSGPGTVIRSRRINRGFGFGPPLNTAQMAQIDRYFASLPAGAAVPIPNSVVLMASAIAFLGFSRRGISTSKSAQT